MSSSSQLPLPVERGDSYDSSQSLVAGLESSPAIEVPSPQPSRLGLFFDDGRDQRTKYSDADIQQISRLLGEQQQLSWSQAPRLYIVLRVIGQLALFDAILERDVRDDWFPFDSVSVPALLSPVLRNEFLDTQHLVLTKAVDLEKNKDKPHIHFKRNEVFPFDIRERLGKGGCSTVDRVVSQISHREYARKTFPRPRGGNKGEVERFRNELKIFKRIQHRHCVELVASYTDSKNFGLFLSPVADCNLYEFFSKTVGDPHKTNVLRHSFGCLASAVAYLHENKVKHRDIKPENVLIKGSNIYLTDFGISLDWQALSRCTTTEDAGKTFRYCAPEVANGSQRNEKADIWSLGCVFFEICVVLKGQMMATVRDDFKNRSGSYNYHQNLGGISFWTDKLQGCGLEADSTPLQWVRSMLGVEAALRPSPRDLYVMICKTPPHPGSTDGTFYAECCTLEDHTSSTDDSASDSDAWAAHSDEDATSPPLTSKDQNKIITESASPLQVSVKEKPINNELVSASLPFVVDSEQSLSKGEDESLAGTAEVSAFSWESGPKSFPSSDLPLRKSALSEETRTRLDLTESRRPDAASPSSPVELVENPTNSRNVPVGHDESLRAQGHSLDTESSIQPPSGQSVTSDRLSLLDCQRSAQDVASLDRDTEEKHGQAADVTKNASDDEDKTGRELVVVQESQEWPEYVLDTQPVPKLNPIDWDSPSRLLHAVKYDYDFRQTLRSKSPQVFRLVEAAQLKDITNLVRFLVQNGMDLNSKTCVNRFNVTPLHKVVAWKHGNFETLVMDMIQAGASIDARASYRYFYSGEDTSLTPFNRAADVGHVWALRAFYHDEKAEPPGCEYAMAYAAISGHVDVMSYLMDRGMKLTSQDERGRTPIWLASRWGQEGVVRFILEKHEGSLDLNGSKLEDSPIHIACQNNHPKIVSLLLLNGADVNSLIDWDEAKHKNYRRRPLDVASESGHVDIVSMLLENGGKGSYPGHPLLYGTPLLYACEANHLEVARILLAHNANPRSDWKDIFGSAGESCICYAVKNQNVELVKILLEKGARVGHRKRFFEGSDDTIRLAEKGGNPEIVGIVAAARAREKAARKAGKG